MTDPITTAHRRSIALVRHAARGDHDSVNLLLAELAGDPVALLVQVQSLVHLCIAMAPRGVDVGADLEQMALLWAQSGGQG